MECRSAVLRWINFSALAVLCSHSRPQNRQSLKQRGFLRVLTTGQTSNQRESERKIWALSLGSFFSFGLRSLPSANKEKRLGNSTRSADSSCFLPEVKQYRHHFLIVGWNLIVFLSFLGGILNVKTRFLKAISFLQYESKT